MSSLPPPVPVVPTAAVLDFAAGKIGTIEPIVYGTADGMRTRECSGGGHPSGWKGRDGKLWFSTLKGVAVLDPARLKVNAQPPGVVIEQVRIDDESVAPSSKIELPPGKSRFDFYYAGLSFVAPEKVRFKTSSTGLIKIGLTAARVASPTTRTFRRASTSFASWPRTTTASGTRRALRSTSI